MEIGLGALGRVVGRSDLPLANRALWALGSALFALLGWRIEGTLPDPPKCVLILTHTSNWDFVIGMAALCVDTRGFSKCRFAWLGKQELFRWPWGAFFRWTGGIPVDRQSSHGMVQQMVQVLRTRKDMVLAVAPEGTRRKTSNWRTGFYYIAHGAGVPIVCGALDYGPRVATIGPTFVPSGHIEADMQIIREFYRAVSPLHPQQASDVQVAPRGDEP